MAYHSILHPNVMADSAQAIWNDVRIVYGSGDPKVPMEGRERTCFFSLKTIDQETYKIVYKV
jgi:hypothetical protein